MRPAQNLPDQALTAITDVLSAGVGVPGWIAGIVVLLVAVTYCVTRILHGLDKRQITSTACKKITTERAAVEALRITSAPRWIFSRPPADNTSASGAPGGALVDDGQATSDPPQEPSGDEPP